MYKTGEHEWSRLVLLLKGDSCAKFIISVLHVSTGNCAKSANEEESEISKSGRKKSDSYMSTSKSLSS